MGNKACAHDARAKAVRQMYNNTRDNRRIIELQTNDNDNDMNGNLVQFYVFNMDLLLGFPLLHFPIHYASLVIRRLPFAAGCLARCLHFLQILILLYHFLVPKCSKF